jgi:indolepyruvate ferredoxin oxidoreductase alpha subunit
LAQVAEEMDLYVEWSVNEKVALEVAAAASVSGLNALTAMKQNGLNVAADFLFNLNLTGIRGGGLVLIVCDDPYGISSTNEQDSRLFAKIGDLPLFEPGSFNEAKDMVVEAFEVSRKTSVPCIVRSVTRISHARGNVHLGALPSDRPKPYFDVSETLSALPASVSHPQAHSRLRAAEALLENSRFNSYSGPDNPQLIIISSGAPRLFVEEAVDMLNLGHEVGMLNLGVTWPLPEKFILEKLKLTQRVLFIEEVDPVLENNVKELFADHNRDLPSIEFLG